MNLNEIAFIVLNFFGILCCLTMACSSWNVV